MALLNDALDEDVRAEKILAVLDAEEAKAAGAGADDPPPPAPDALAPESPAAPADDAAPAQPQPSGDDAPQPDPAPEPPIEAPASWSKEWKEKFQSLPRDVQHLVADRERERDVELRRGQNEAADIRRTAEAAQKAADERAAAAAQEQQRYAQTLAALAQQVEVLDPVIAEYQRTDLVKLARENPARYAELDAAYKGRMGALQAFRAEQMRVQNEASAAHMAREEKALLSRVPEWSDQQVGHKALTDIREGIVKAYGYKPEEVRVIADHRHVLLARDALEAPKLRAQLAELQAKVAESEAKAKAAIEAKRVPQAAPKVVKPNPSTENSEKAASDRSKAIIKSAGKARSLAEKAEILAQLD